MPKQNYTAIRKKDFYSSLFIGLIVFITHLVYLYRHTLTSAIDEAAIDESYLVIEMMFDNIAQNATFAYLSQFFAWGAIGLVLYALWLMMLRNIAAIRNFYIIEKFYINHPKPSKALADIFLKVFVLGVFMVYFILLISLFVPLWLDLSHVSLFYDSTLRVIINQLIVYAGLSFFIYIQFLLFRLFDITRRNLLQRR